jgi:ABC-type Fe3+-hydroxamate transport system substrate-binding protein
VTDSNTPFGPGTGVPFGHQARPEVVSLVPSITETLLGWGVRPAAVTRFCEAPGVPTVGGTKNPDIGGIVALRPGLVLMDEEENRREDAAALQAAGVKVLATAIRRVEDVGPALATVANAIGVDEVASFSAITEAPARIRVFVPIWRRPWMTIGASTYASSLLSYAGFANVYAERAEPYPKAGPEEIASLGADFVLAPSEPYHFTERHRAELEIAAPVVFVDGQDLFWWGIRTPAALARLRELAADLSRR